VFYAGESTEFELPNNSTVTTLKEFKLSNDEANPESIIDIACGNRYNLYVTSKGRVWASGRQFLKRVGMDSESAVPLHLPNEPGLSVLRVWAS
jgi:alpha-tubulin suppressor-like RCC1 family protein